VLVPAGRHVGIARWTLGVACADGPDGLLDPDRQQSFGLSGSLLDVCLPVDSNSPPDLHIGLAVASGAAYREPQIAPWRRFRRFGALNEGFC
jgi:hypothetical protein